MLTKDQWRSFLSKLGTLFFLQGYIKSTGVLVEGTVRYFHTEVYLVGLSYSLVSGLSNFFAPLVSKMMDYVSHRSLGVIGGFLLGSGFLAQGLLATQIWQLIVCTTISGIGFGLINLPTSVGIGDNFGKASEYATVIGIISLLSNVGLAVLPIVVETWQEQYGLLWSVALLGTLLWNNVPLCMLLSSDSPKTRFQKLEKGLPNRIATSGREHDPSKRRASLLVSHPSLITLYITRMIHTILMNTWAMFLIPMAVQKGFDQSVAVYLSTVGGAGLFAGKLLAVATSFFDKIDSLLVMIPQVLCIPIMCVLYLLFDGFVPLALITFVVALGLGVLSTWVYGYIMAACCQFHFKEATSWASTISGIGAILAGITSGLVYDIRGQYSDVFTFMAIVSTISMLTMAATIVMTTSNSDCDLSYISKDYPSSEEYVARMTCLKQ